MQTVNPIIKPAYVKILEFVYLILGILLSLGLLQIIISGDNLNFLQLKALVFFAPGLPFLIIGLCLFFNRPRLIKLGLILSFLSIIWYAISLLIIMPGFVRKISCMREPVGSDVEGLTLCVNAAIHGQLTDPSEIIVGLVVLCLSFISFFAFRKSSNR